MANTQVFTGSDATLTLATETGPEGDAAKTAIEFYKLSPVGRATNVKIYVQAEVDAFWELGARHPVDLGGGNISITGSLDRAYINGALLATMLADGSAENRKKEPYAQPAFNLVLNLTDPAAPGTTSTLTIHGVKFESWSFNLPEDDFVMESVTFKGLFITVGDKEAAAA